MTRISAAGAVAVAISGGPPGTNLKADERGQLVVEIPAAAMPAELDLRRWAGDLTDFELVAAEPQRLRMAITAQPTPSFHDLSAGWW